MTGQPKPAVTVGCSARVLRREDHAPHNWEPQPGMDPVRCPGYWVEKSPGSGLSAPESHETPLSGIERRPGGEFGPQAGAQSLDTRPAPDDGLRDRYVMAISRVLLDSAGRIVPKHIAETAKAVADSADAVLAVRDREMEQLRERLRKAERAVNLLTDSHRRAEQAEAAIARVEALAGRLELAQYGVDLEADGIRRAIARDIRAALDYPQQDDRTTS